MAKYLKLFMVTLFATMTFTFTSCGDDEDAPKPSSKVELTIDGVKYSYEVRMGDFDPNGDGDLSSDGMWMLEGAESTKYEDLMITIPVGNLVEVGKPLKDDIVFFCSSSYYWPDENDTSVQVKSLSKNSITIVFSSTKMIEEPYRGHDTFIVNGTITLPFPLP